MTLGASDELAFVDVKELLLSLGDLAASDLILIGGQALNFWVDYYQRRGRLPAQGQPPLTSKDIDFFAPKEAVQKCAYLLKGEARLPGMDEATPSLGTVTYVDSHGAKRIIDFIPPFGLREQDVIRTAQTIELLDDTGQPTGQTFQVLHPVWGMIGRAYNTVRLPRYRTAHALRQLSASVACARVFNEDLLDRGQTKAVLKLNERIFSFCYWDPVGRELWRDYSVDAFSAVVDDVRLPDLFRNQRHPQMQSCLAERRARLRRANPAAPTQRN